MEVAEQDGATKRQELSELQTPPSPPQALLKHICLSLMEASGHQLTNTVPSHRSQSRDKHVGDRRVISIAETSIRYN